MKVRTLAQLEYRYYVSECAIHLRMAGRESRLGKHEMSHDLTLQAVLQIARDFGDAAQTLESGA